MGRVISPLKRADQPSAGTPVAGAAVPQSRSSSPVGSPTPVPWATGVPDSAALDQ
ncbi:MAG TPA: hypothetical protein VM142_06450 [Acidimicrobiales bacterium]|nr:hypothetical protein [Acidimicrobiales bacterium]